MEDELKRTERCFRWYNKLSSVVLLTKKGVPMNSAVAAFENVKSCLVSHQ